MILEKPKCSKCGKDAMCLVSDIWLCGDCVVELDKRMKEQKKKMIMEIQE